MNTTVLLFHPNLAASRINARLAQAARGAGTAENPVEVRDMYALYPDFKVDVAAEQAVCEATDRIVLQFPMYWYSSPALLKQWQDDVLTYGWAYGAGGNALAGKEWLSLISTGGPADSYQAGGYNRFSMSEFLKPLQQTAHLLQTTFLPPFIFHGAVQATPEAVAQSAEAMLAHLRDPLLDPQKRLAALLGKMQEDGVAL